MTQMSAISMIPMRFQRMAGLTSCSDSAEMLAEDPIGSFTGMGWPVTLEIIMGIGAIAGNKPPAGAEII